MTTPHLGLHHRAGQPPARHHHTGRVPVTAAALGVLAVEPLRDRPDRAEIGTGHPQVARRNSRHQGLGDLHTSQSDTRHRQFASSKQVTGPADR